MVFRKAMCSLISFYCMIMVCKENIIRYCPLCYPEADGDLKVKRQIVCGKGYCVYSFAMSLYSRFKAVLYVVSLVKYCMFGPFHQRIYFSFLLMTFF